MKAVLVVFVSMHIMLSLFVFGVFSKSFRRWIIQDLGIHSKYAQMNGVTTDRYTTNAIVTNYTHPANWTVQAEALESKFSYEAADLLRETSIACKPETFGYTMKESELKFPYAGYPRCSEKYQMTYERFVVNYTDNVFELVCKGNNSGEYILGNSGPFTFPEINEARPFLRPQKYPGHPIKFNSSVDYVLARCDQSKDQGFPIAAHFPRLNKRRFQESMKLRGSSKPLIVMLMVLDSFSRRHFFQKLPLTLAYFEELNTGSDFAVYDFKLHNVIGDGSADNTIPIFKGGIQTDGGLNSDRTHRFFNKIGKEAIWEDFKKKVRCRQGFMTALVFEGCDLKFPDEIGRVTHPDHLVRHFYCALTSLGTMSTDKRTGSEQRCVGPQMTHVYGFDYISNFTSIYSGANQWIYAHFEAGHEASGRHAETIDLDLRNFFKDYLRRYGQENEIVIMTMADHGMRFGDWFKDVRGYQEHKLPAFFFLASRRYLDSLPQAYESLRHNSWKLMSKKDIRRTLLFLSDYPKTEAEIPADSYAACFNLLSELIPENRTCQDAGIPVWYCSCLNFQDIEIGSWNEELSEILKIAVDLSISTMNNEIYSGTHHPKGYACERIEPGEVRNAYGVQANLHQEILKVVFSVKNSPSASFTATLMLSPYPFGVRGKWGLSMWMYNLPMPVMYRGVKTYLNLILLSRMDKYEGPCETASAKMGVKAEFCFCKDWLVKKHS